MRESCLQAFHGRSKTDLGEGPGDGVVSVALIRDFGEGVRGDGSQHYTDDREAQLGIFYLDPYMVSQ